MKNILVTLCVAGVAGVALAGYGTRIVGAKPATWDGSFWLASPDAKVADDATRKAQRAADGTSWFKRDIVNAKAVKRAIWFVTGLGVFEVYVNGMPVGDEVLKPGFTQIHKTHRAFAYDVTSLMQTALGAKNTLVAEVSAGWWRDKIVNYAGKTSAFRAVLEVEYADGTRTAFGTQPGVWLAAEGGPVKHAGIFDGEEFDARCDVAHFVADASVWKPSKFSTEETGEILPSEGGEVYRRKDLALKPVEAYLWKGVTGADAAKKIFGKVVKTRTFKPGEPLVVLPGETLVVDFAQNAAAIPYFEMRAPEGTRLTCLPGEMLNDANGEISRGNDGPSGSIYRENLRIPKDHMEVLYTFGAGDCRVSYMPRFTFFGYRYISLTATAPVCIDELLSIPVTSITKAMETGHLETGHPAINKLISNVYWGQLSNYLSVPTDCPQRNERLGWTADTQVFCEAGAYNANTTDFFLKWTRDLRDNRDEEGSYPSVAPKAQYGNETFSLGWADAGVIVPWTIWRQYGNRKMLSDNWEAMSKFVRLLDRTRYSEMHHPNGGTIYADWLSFERYESHDGWAKWKNDPNARDFREFLSACYWLYDARLMAEMARYLERYQDIGFFEASAARALNHIRKTYLEKDGLLLKSMRDMQCACVFALKHGIVEGDARDKTLQILIDNINAHEGCLQTGFLGTSFLMDALTDAGRPDVAWGVLLSRKCPGWLYSVDQGATTIWERWNSYRKDTGFGPVGMNSFNHYAYGAVLAWLYRAAAGIAPDARTPGYKHFFLAPKPDRRVGHLTAEYSSASGLIRSAWRYEGNTLIWNFTIPAGTTADVQLPGERSFTLYNPGTYERRFPR